LAVLSPHSLIISAECAAARCGATAIQGAPVLLSVRTDRQLLKARAQSVRYVVVSSVAISDRFSQTSELGEAPDVVWRNAALTISVPVGAVVTLLNQCRSAHNGGDLRVELGDITANQELQLSFRIQFASGVELSHTSVIASLTGNDEELKAEGEITFRYVSHAESDLQTRDETIYESAMRPISAGMLESPFALAEAVAQHRGPDGKARRPSGP